MIPAFQVGLYIDTRKMDIETFVLALFFYSFSTQSIYCMNYVCLRLTDWKDTVHMLSLHKQNEFTLWHIDWSHDKPERIRFRPKWKYAKPKANAINSFDRGKKGEQKKRVARERSTTTMRHIAFEVFNTHQ